MGLSSKKTKTTSNQTATTTPSIPTYAEGPIKDYYSQLANFGNGNISDWTAPVNSNLSSAFGAGADLLQGNPYLQQSAAGIQQFLNTQPQGGINLPAPPMPANASLPASWDVARTNPGSASWMQANLPGAPQFYGATAANDPTLSLARTGTLGNAAQAYAGATPGIGNLADPSQWNVNASQADGMDAITASTAADYMGRYNDPWQQDVIDAVLADLEKEQGAQLADYEAQGLMNKGFGSANYDLGRAEMISDNSRAKAATEAALRSQGFQTALGAGAADADRASQATALTAQLEAARRGQNAGLSQEANLANANRGGEFEINRFLADNAMRSLGYTTQADLSKFNAGQGNEFALSRYGAENTAQGQNAAAENARQSQIYDTLTNVNLSNAERQQRLAELIYGTQADFSQFNAGQKNAADALTYQTRASADAQNAQAQNAQASQVYDTRAQFSQNQADRDAQLRALIYGTQYDANKSNADLELQRRAQQLQALGVLGNVGQASTDDYLRRLAALTDLGQTQYGIDTINSPLYALQQYAGLLNPSGVVNLGTGQTIKSDGTSTSKTSGGLFNDLLSIGGLLGAAAIKR